LSIDYWASLKALKDECAARLKKNLGGRAGEEDERIFWG